VTEAQFTPAEVSLLADGRAEDMTRFGFFRPSAVQALPKPFAQGLSLNLSASQLKTWHMCRRKWAFQKVYGIKEREKHHLKIGHVLHEVAERYLTRVAKTWLDLFPSGWDEGLESHESDWVKLCAELAVTKGLWQSSAGLLIEHPVALLVGDRFLDSRGMPLAARATTYTDESGVRRIDQLVCLADGSPLPPGYDELPPVVGFIDMIDLTSASPWVIDHKSAKSRRYALTPEKLAVDVQVNLYAAYALGQRPSADRVLLRHNVFLKDFEAKDIAYHVDAETTLSRVQEQWRTTIQAAKDMAEVRRIAPRIEDPHEPSKRADNCMKVSSAIDAGNAKDACSAYGGCPFKDVCYGRATPQQIVRRLDAPDPVGIIRRPEPVFGLRLRHLPNAPAPAGHLPPVPTISEPAMPFISPAVSTALAIALGKVVYLRDPQDAQVQYKAVVGHIEGEEVRALIYPRVDVEFSHLHLPLVYQEKLPKSALSTVPFPDAQLRGYAAALVGAGIDDQALVWTDSAGKLHDPRLPEPAPAPAQESKSARPPRDGKFGFGAKAPTTPADAPAAGVANGVQAPLSSPIHAMAAQMERAKQAKAEADASLPPLDFIPAEGQTVQVKDTAHSFFAQFSLVRGKIVSVEQGETQPIVTVVLEDGMELTDVAAGRFALVQAEGASGVTPAWVQLNPLVGSPVSISIKGASLPTVGVLNGVDEQGLVALDGKLKLPWMQVAGVVAYVPPPPKPTREEKAAAKAAAKAQAEADARPKTLAEVIAAAEVLLASGKVTKKAMEGFVEALKNLPAGAAQQTGAGGGVTADALNPVLIDALKQIAQIVAQTRAAVGA
jgi:hypothetical protein